MNDKTDTIAAEHGCVIEPAANGRLCISVLPRHQAGFPGDRDRISKCRAALVAAGIADAASWLS